MSELTAGGDSRAPEGWYPDPERLPVEHVERFWDGARWTDSRRYALPGTPPAQGPRERLRREEPTRPSANSGQPQVAATGALNNAGPQSRPWWKEYLWRSRRGRVIMVFITVAVAARFGLSELPVTVTRVHQNAMAPTAVDGQRLLTVASWITGSPSVGDLVVVEPPEGALTRQCGLKGQGPFYHGPRGRELCSKPTPQRAEGERFVERVVAGPGSRISIRRGRAVVDGRTQALAGSADCTRAPECNLGGTKIKTGYWFLLGDNRSSSNDSRYWGPVPESWIRRSAVMSLWPPGGIGG